MGAFGDFFNKAKSYVSFREFLFEVQNNNTGYVAAYLKKNPGDLNRRETLSGKNVLMYAVEAGATSTVKLLLAKGASLGGQDNSGFTVLHLAALGSHKAITNMLLQNDGIAAVINEKNRLNGLTALMCAASGADDPALVQSLIDKGANPAAKDFMGRTAFSIAQKKGNTKMAALLEQWTPKSAPDLNPGLRPNPRPNLNLNPNSKTTRRRQPPKPRQFDL